VSNGMRNSQATHVDFGFLRGAIKSNPKVIPVNLDMVYEHKGHFLFAEWKRENEEISEGQKILLRNLAKLHTVLLIIGHSDENSTEVKDFYWIRGLYMMHVGKGIDSLKDYIDDWWNEY